MTTPAPAGRQSAIPEALDYAGDRTDRLAHTLGTLEDALNRLGARLAPVLPDAPHATPGTHPSPGPDAEADLRGPIARAIADLGRRCDNYADQVNALAVQVDALIDRLEV